MGRNEPIAKTLNVSYFLEMSSSRFHCRNASEISPHKYTCGHCDNQLSSNDGYTKGGNSDGSGGTIGYIYLCHHCSKPTYFEDGKQIPGSKPGEKVSGIDDLGVEALYAEARDAYSQNAFTASVLCCRKLLMHVAVNKGALIGQSFIQYVEYLSNQNYIPPDAKDWVDHIRKKGNEANHEIIIMTKEDAKDLLAFLEMLLKLVYEFPANIKKKLLSASV